MPNVYVVTLSREKGVPILALIIASIPPLALESGVDDIYVNQPQSNSGITVLIPTPAEFWVSTTEPLKPFDIAIALDATGQSAHHLTRYKSVLFQWGHRVGNRVEE